MVAELGDLDQQHLFGEVGGHGVVHGHGADHEAARNLVGQGVDFGLGTIRVRGCDQFVKRLLVSDGL